MRAHTHTHTHAHTRTHMHTRTHTHAHTHTRTHAYTHTHAHTYTHTRRELGDQETTFRCHYDLGLLHMQERHPALALRCFQAALGVARELSEPDLEGEALAEMAQVGGWEVCQCRELLLLCVRVCVAAGSRTAGEL